MASCWIFYMNYTMMHGSTNIKFSRQIFEKYFNTNLIKTVQWKPRCSVRTDRRTGK